MRVLSVIIIMVLPFLSFSQDRVRFKYFENTEEFKRGEFKGLVKGVEFYDTAGRMTSEYDFTTIEPLDRIYKLGLENNWIEQINYKVEGSRVNTYSRSDSIFWSPFITSKQCRQFKPEGIKDFYPVVIYKNDSMLLLAQQATFYFQEEGADKFDPHIYKVKKNEGVKLLPVKYPHAFRIKKRGKDGKWMLGFHGTEFGNCDRIYDEPTIFLINLETGVIDLKLPVSFNFRTENDKIGNYTIYDYDLIYYIDPVRRVYWKYIIDLEKEERVNIEDRKIIIKDKEGAVRELDINNSCKPFYY
jgi:hypothetical protein